MKKKEVKRICKNCKLFENSKNECKVVILHEGKRINIPVESNDPCFFEQEYFDPTTKAIENLNEIKEVKFWVEDEKGEKTSGDGTVKMEYPEDFFECL